MSASNSFPFADLVGLEIGDTDDSPSGRDSVVHLEATDDHLNIAGIVHGGVLATLVDTAMGRAVRSVTEDTPATSQLTITYLEPARPGTLTATARVTKRGSTLTIVEAEVERDDKPVAHALATFALIKK